MQITNLEIPGVKIIEYDEKSDNRGYRYVTFDKKVMDLLNFNYVNERVYSITSKNTLFGIHLQKEPFDQNKLIYVIEGSGIDYAIDLRKDSKTYMKYVSVTLSASNHKQIFIPKGCGHIFLSLENNTKNVIRVDKEFNSEYSVNIKYNDPTLDIVYPINNPILSDKDKNAKSFLEQESKL